MDYIPPGSSVHGILQTRLLEWFAIPFSRETSQPRDWTQVSCIAGELFTIWVTLENILTNTVTLIVHYLYLLLFMFESTIGWLQWEKNSGEKPYTEPPPTISISQSCRLGLNFLLILS